MSETASSERASAEPEKPAVTDEDEVQLPPFPDPTDLDFDDITEEEQNYYKNKFSDLGIIATMRLHCTACDRHLGCSPLNESRMRTHPMLRTLICQTCHSFYNSGEFDRGEDGSELYCRWCGQGGQVYCCSDCIHVFCAKCIKRNLGLPKIKEIENTDDWKCFKCNPNCLWDLRALCWALLRYCDLRNKLVDETEDADLKVKYSKVLAIDQSDCCKNKARRSQKLDIVKKKEKDADYVANVTKKIISKIAPTIQVKKFASVNMDNLTKPKIEKKAQKRPASPKAKPMMIKNPITIAPCAISGGVNKKFRMSSPNILSPMRFPTEPLKKVSMPRAPRPRILGSNFNGFSPRLYNPLNNANVNMNNMNNMNLNMNMGLISDNINLSLDSLTQGLDFAAVQAMNNSNNPYGSNDDVVCTPDFPLEPLCEVTEDIDDDVECITPCPPAPAPAKTPSKVINPPPLVSRTAPSSAVPPASVPAPAHSKDNIIQMTDSDVTVNSLTGGLKFRVDPQTLSSNKMYRLPDGRVFAINANPNMPGGYSATIVSQNSDGTPRVSTRSETFAAKLSAVPHSSPKPRGRNAAANKRKNPPKPKPAKPKDTYISRETDDKVPVEWYRYNMLDAVDALEYSLSRLHKLKKETTTAHLRSRTVDEMKYLHRTLEQLLSTSSKRFTEIRDTLNKEMKLYLTHKQTRQSSDDDDDDDVEILPNTENDDPIFIDENSVDSVTATDHQEVDLTEAASFLNDSTENRNDVDPINVANINANEDSNTSANVLNHFRSDADPLSAGAANITNEHSNSSAHVGNHFNVEDKHDNGDAETAKEHLLGNHDDSDKMETDDVPETTTTVDAEPGSETKTSKLNGDEKPDDKDEDKTEDDRTDDDEIDKTDIKTDDKGDIALQNDDEKVDENKQQSEDKVVADEESNDDVGDDQNTEDKSVTDARNSDHNVDPPDTDRDAEMSEELIENLLKDDNLDENVTMEMADLQEAEEILS